MIVRNVLYDRRSMHHVQCAIVGVYVVYNAHYALFEKQKRNNNDETDEMKLMHYKNSVWKMIMQCFAKHRASSFTMQAVF